MSFHQARIKDSQINTFIYPLDASNFFSTQPFSQTARKFYIKSQSSFEKPIGKDRYVETSRHLESFNISTSLNKLVKESSHNKMRRVKQRLSQTKSVYLNELQHTHRKLKNFENMNHHTQILKSKFIDLYQTKKFKLDSEKIILKAKISKQDFIRNSFQNVKQKKQQKNLSIFTLQKSQQDKIKSLQHNNKKQKKELSESLNKAFFKQRKWRLQKINQVIQSANQFIIRKQTEQRIRKIKSRFNYTVRIKEQSELIDEYKSLIKIIQNQNPQALEKINKQKIKDKQTYKKQQLTTAECASSLEFLTEPFQTSTGWRQKQSICFSN